MLSIRTVLCPVDLSPASPRHVDIAASLCHAFGARLVLHHNLIEFGIGSGVRMDGRPAIRTLSGARAEQLAELITRVPSGTHAGDTTHCTVRCSTRCCRSPNRSVRI